MPTIAEAWRTHAYRSVASYTRMPYPDWLQNAGQTLFRDCTLAMLRAWAAPRRPLRRVVDLACGVGDWTAAYLDFAERVVGVEINPQFLAVARRHRALCARPDDLDLREMNLVDFDDFAGADLVCLGACLSCLGDAEVDAVLGRIGRAQSPGDALYVRVTTLNPLRGPFGTSIGHYRPRGYYTERLRAAGYEVYAAGYSTAVPTAQLLAHALGLRSARAALALGALVNAPLRTVRAVTRATDFYNLFLERR